MDKKDSHTTIFPYYQREEFNFYYEVGKLRMLKKKVDLVVLLDTIGRKAKEYDAFQYLYNIHIQGDWKMVKDSILSEMEKEEKMGYTMIELHMDKSVMGDDDFYKYLKRRIEEEFYGDIQFAVCWKEDCIEKIVLIYSDIINVKQIRINLP